MKKCKRKTNTLKPSEGRVAVREPKPKNRQRDKMGRWEAGHEKNEPCQVCGKPSVGRDLCRTHYGRWYRLGDVQADVPISLARYGPNHAGWKGGELFDKGRVKVYSPDHPSASRKYPYVLRYRLVMEKHIGRFLKKGEIIHHKNGNPSDDRIENLEITNLADHRRLHAKQIGWSIRHKKCVKCGSSKRKHRAHGFCRKCYKTQGFLSKSGGSRKSSHNKPKT